MLAALLIGFGTAHAAPSADDFYEYEPLFDDVEADVLVEAVLAPKKVDLPALISGGTVRFAVAPDPILIAVDGFEAVGAAIAAGRELEKLLGQRAGTDGESPSVSPVVLPVPIPRALIGEAITEGRADFATMPVTPDNRKRVAFTRPIIENVRDLVVLSPEAAGAIETFDDLVLFYVAVPEGTIYEESMVRLNRARREQGKTAIPIRRLDPLLDDYDLMEMAAVGLVPATLMSRHKLEVWSKIHPEAVVRRKMIVRERGAIAFAARPDAPKLLAALDDFAEKVAKGTLLGNIIYKRFFKDADRIENIATSERQERIAAVEPVIRRFSNRYSFDSDLVLAQAYQESRLDPEAVSHMGAQGIMQVLPSTARDRSVAIPDISSVENNVHAGVKYLRYLRNTHFDDDAISALDQTLFAFAAYNAGPGNMAKARRQAKRMGLDPNVWFENVEVAIGRAVSREPVVYVRNIYKYFVAHRLLRAIREERAASRVEANLPEGDATEAAE